MTANNKNNLATTCPHCGVMVSFPALTNVVRAEYDDDMSTDGSGAMASCKDDIFLSICVNCGHPVLVGRNWDDASVQTSTYTYPRHVKKASSDLPDEIRKGLNEIYKCMSVWAYAATSVMCRRLIERCCQYFQCNKKPLMKQIDVLLTEKFPNETLRRQAHLIRYIGNEGAHADGEVHWDDAEALVVFCEEITHHLFITQKKLQEITNRRQETIKKKKRISIPKKTD